MIKRIGIFGALFFATIMTFAQMQEPVKCETTWKMVNDSITELRITATISAGWHVYSTELEDGPTAATLFVEDIEGAHLTGKLEFEGKEITKYDEMFGVDVRYFENKATFIQRFVIDKNECKIQGYFQYGACDDESCMPPTDVTFEYSKQ